MKPALALLAVCLVSGCATTANPAARTYSPSEVLGATKELNGKEILVRGWIGGCGANDNRICGIYSNRRAAIGPEPREWPLPIDFGVEDTPVSVRQVLARGTYVVTCKNDETTVCVEYDGHFQLASIED